MVSITITRRTARYSARLRLERLQGLASLPHTYYSRVEVVRMRMGMHMIWPGRTLSGVPRTARHIWPVKRYNRT